MAKYVQIGKLICAHVKDVSKGIISAACGSAFGKFASIDRTMAVHEYCFVLGLTKDSANNTELVIFVDRLSNMAHLAAGPDTVNGIN